MSREHDLLLWGATGFTGGLVAEYLTRHAGEVRWAIGGRDPVKLAAVKRRIVAIDPAAKAVGVVQARAEDEGALERMTAQARVVLSTVGPYARHGEPLVRACLATRSDYLDITGEPAFVAMLQERYDAEARDAGVLLVSCCGFDSIPADLGVLFNVLKLPPRAEKSVRGYVKSRGTFSGGTWASALGIMADAGLGGLRAGDGKIHREEVVRGWGVPMPVVDPLIVRRSASARPEVYGPGFRYEQYLRLSSLPQVAATVGGVGGVVALAQLAPARRWLEKLRPSGAGPSEEQRKKSFFELTFIGEGGGQRAVTRVRGGDPGYDETAKMLSESGLLVARSRAELPQAGGVTTPAAALGERLIERLQAAGISFEVVGG